MRICWLVVVACVACAKPKYDCARTREVLANADVETLRRLPARTVWKLYPRSIENEARLRRYLDAKLDPNRGGEAPYTLECRAVVCRVKLNPRLEHGPSIGVLRGGDQRDERVIRDYDDRARETFVWLVETDADAERMRKPTRCGPTTAGHVERKLAGED